MIPESDLPSIDADLQRWLSKSFLTALAVVGNASRAEVLVLEVIEGLDPENISSGTLRDATIQRLVEEQMESAYLRGPSTSCAESEIY